MSGVLRYACRNLRWINENPCSNLVKLKENPKERRTLSEDEAVRLLAACKKSKNRYLFAITLLAMTTRRAQGRNSLLTWDRMDFEQAIRPH